MHLLNCLLYFFQECKRILLLILEHIDFLSLALYLQLLDRKNHFHYYLLALYILINNILCFVLLIILFFQLKVSFLILSLMKYILLKIFYGLFKFNQ
jgi:hypothetical protein